MSKRRTTRSDKTVDATPNGHDADSAVTPVKLGWLAGALGYNLRLAQNASFHAFSELVGDTGLRPGRYALLHLIHNNPGISQTALSQASGRDKSTLTPLLGDLERRGLILRGPDPRDRRGRRLSLTNAGVIKLAQLAECAAQHEALLNAVLGQQQQQLVSLLKMLIEGLDPDMSPPLPTADEV